MLITNLGKTRLALISSFDTLSDGQLNQPGGEGARSIAQIIVHLHASEIETARSVLVALPHSSGKVAERDLAVLAELVRAHDTAIAPLAHALTKAELIGLLEESRFKYLQDVFNETHAQTLAEKSMQHAVYGEISLKNLIDTIWLHEQEHTRQITQIKAAL